MESPNIADEAIAPLEQAPSEQKPSLFSVAVRTQVLAFLEENSVMSPGIADRLASFLEHAANALRVLDPIGGEAMRRPKSPFGMISAPYSYSDGVENFGANVMKDLQALVPKILDVQAKKAEQKENLPELLEALQQARDMKLDDIATKIEKQIADRLAPKSEPIVQIRDISPFPSLSPPPSPVAVDIPMPQPTGT